MNDSDASERRLEGDSASASRESSVGDVPGAPTWPIEAPGSGQPAPPVGLNWTAVSQALGIDVELLQHEGVIVVAGDYFPESGYFFDPETMAAQHVDVGDFALRHGYFLGSMTARDFAQRYPLAPKSPPARGAPVVRQTRGAVIGLFADRRGAARAKAAVMQGALGAGIRLEDGPLGSELRVDRPEQTGAVATIIAAHGGAVISIGGEPVVASPRGAMTPAPSMVEAQADAWRPGTGSASDSQAPSVETGGSEEFPRL